MPPESSGAEAIGKPHRTYRVALLKESVQWTFDQLFLVCATSHRLISYRVVMRELGQRKAILWGGPRFISWRGAKHGVRVHAKQAMAASR